MCLWCSPSQEGVFNETAWFCNSRLRQKRESQGSGQLLVLQPFQDCHSKGRNLCHSCVRILSQLCSPLSLRAPKDKELELRVPLLPLLGSPVAETHWAVHSLGRAGLLGAQEQNFSTSPPPVPTGFELLSAGFLCCSQGKVLTRPRPWGQEYCRAGSQQ